MPVHLKGFLPRQGGLRPGEGYLIPIAYRDHRVAQQCPPQALQGKVFTSQATRPFRAGHPHQARRREAHWRRWSRCRATPGGAR